LAGQIVQREGNFIASLFVAYQRIFQGSTPVKTSVECISQQFSVTKSVGDAKGQGGIFVIASIANQCPAWTVGPTKEIWQIGGAYKATLALAAAYTGCQIGGEIKG